MTLTDFSASRPNMPRIGAGCLTRTRVSERAGPAEPLWRALVASPAMDEVRIPSAAVRPVSVAKLSFNDGTELHLEPNSVVVFVGANNVGKSQALANIAEDTGAIEKDNLAHRIASHRERGTRLGGGQVRCSALVRGERSQ